MKILSLFLILFALTGCDLSSSTGADLLDQYGNTVPAEQNTDAAETPPTQTDTTPPPAQSGNGQSGSVSQSGFLWKPDSESTGNLVVLLPPSTRGRTQGVATISGSFGTESASMRHEHHNGGRPHFYFSKPGSAYGSNITVQAPLTDGSVFSIVVPNGSQRYSR
ncbi:MAG: hypothetical protein WD708_08400 [Kiritimatiellia bacterium]